MTMTQPQPQASAAPAQRPTLKQLIAESGAGGKYFPFSKIGDSIEGKVLDVKILQARDFRTKELQTWASGEPMWNVVPTVQGMPDPTDPEHDGAWSLYIKWWGAQRMALQQALSQVGKDDIEVGGYLKATYVADGPAQAGMNPPKLIEFVYRPPAQVAGLASLPQGPAPAAPQSPKAAPPYPQGYNIPPQPVPTGAAQPQYANGGFVPQQTIHVTGQPGLFAPPAPPAYQPPPAAPAPAPAPPAAAPVTPPTSGDLAAQFAQIKAGLDAGMTPSQILLMVPGVDMATVQAIASAPAQ